VISRTISRIKKSANTIKSDAFLLYLCFNDKRTPAAAKIISITALALAFSPIDLIPDFIPVFGYLDDIIIIPVLIYFAFRLIPDNIVSDNKKLAETLKAKDSPVFRKTGIFIAVLWLSAAVIIVFRIIKYLNFI
jgi:uncharacterized membrane protein YkvA (DUF1232 family)